MARFEFDRGSQQARRTACGHPLQPTAMSTPHAWRHDQVEAGADGLTGVETEQPLARRVPERDPAEMVGADDAVGRRGGDLFETRLSRAMRDGQPPDLQLVEHQRRQRLQMRSLLGREAVAGSTIDDAQRAQCMTTGREQWHAGIEPDEGFAQDRRILHKTHIQLGIRNHEDVIERQRMRAERLVAPALADVQAHPGGKDLPRLFDDRNQDDGHVEQLGCQFDDGIQVQFGVVRLELIVGQGGQTVRFIQQHRRKSHKKPENQSSSKKEGADCLSATCRENLAFNGKSEIATRRFRN